MMTLPGGCCFMPWTEASTGCRAQIWTTLKLAAMRRQNQHVTSTCSWIRTMWIARHFHVFDAPQTQLLRQAVLYRRINKTLDAASLYFSQDFIGKETFYRIRLLKWRKRSILHFFLLGGSLDFLASLWDSDVQESTELPLHSVRTEDLHVSCVVAETLVLASFALALLARVTESRCDMFSSNGR